jgi:hypothetical protein
VPLVSPTNSMRWWLAGGRACAKFLGFGLSLGQQGRTRSWRMVRALIFLFSSTNVLAFWHLLFYSTAYWMCEGLGAESAMDWGGLSAWRGVETPPPHLRAPGALVDPACGSGPCQARPAIPGSWRQSRVRHETGATLPRFGWEGRNNLNWGKAPQGQEGQDICAYMGSCYIIGEQQWGYVAGRWGRCARW